MKKNWWRDKVVYEIYPQSFYDSNNDGIGDIQGILNKLDYLQDLGIDIIWICPIFESPMVDNGYDISNYYSIHSNYGSFEDLEKLIQEAHKRNIKILLDLVVNHCSDQHEWFKKAIQNPESKYRNYFIFRNSVDGKAPNNWRSVFGGSVWEKIPNTNCYYYHTFSKEQPDFNWENENLRKDIYEMINFWLDLGVGGFRIDAITFIKKDLTFKSLPQDKEDGLVSLRTVGINYPGIEVFLKEMKQKTFEKYNAFTVAEMSSVKPEAICNYIGKDGFFNSIFDFSYLNLDLGGTTNWYEHTQFNANKVNNILFKNHDKVQEMDAFLSNVLENHDQPRSLNKWFNEADISFKSASMLAVLNLTLRGIPFIYQGQEIGMTNNKWNSIEEIKEVKSIAQYNAALLEGITPEAAFKAVAYRSRDNARTPMQWDESKNSGFSVSKPWLAVNNNYTEINVSTQKEDSQSIYNFYKKLIYIRKNSEFSDILREGRINQILKEYDSLIAFERTTDSGKLHVLLNYSPVPTDIIYAHEIRSCVITNYESHLYKDRKLTLRPYEAIVFEIGF